MEIAWIETSRTSIDGMNVEVCNSLLPFCFVLFRCVVAAKLCLGKTPVENPAREFSRSLFAANATLEKKAGQIVRNQIMSRAGVNVLGCKIVVRSNIGARFDVGKLNQAVQSEDFISRIGGHTSSSICKRDLEREKLSMSTGLLASEIKFICYTPAVTACTSFSKSKISCDRILIPVIKIRSWTVAEKLSQDMYHPPYKICTFQALAISLMIHVRHW
jgi:hypothetical protein